MCGIVGYIGTRLAPGVLLEGLRRLEYRGYDSAGIALSHSGQLQVIKTKGRLAELEQGIADVNPAPCYCGIGHTRWATHGIPSAENAHPHCNERIAIVHNGIIENYLEWKNYLIEQGYAFQSQTDTEVILHLLDHFYHGAPMQTIREVTSRLKGSYALAILFRDIPDRIYALRKDSPLIIGLGEGEQFIASDIPAILKYTQQYYLMEEGEIALLSKDQVKVYDAQGKATQKEVLTADWSLEAAEKQGYPHFMLKEIYEQPEAFRKTVNPRLGEDDLPLLDAEIFPAKRWNQIKKVHIVACGTAMHAGMVGKNLLETLARIPCEVWIASEFRYADPILSPEDLVIIISQSGETADTLAALRLAKQCKTPTLAIVNVVGSSIAREADHVLFTWAGPEIAVASTKAYTVQLSVLYLLAFSAALERNTKDKAQLQDYCRTLRQIPALMEQVLTHSDTCKELATHFMEAQNLFFIGRGLDYHLSLEGSLKLKEISYIHSEAYAAGELKHGTISLITNDMPVIALATQSYLCEKTYSNVEEVISRGAKVLVIGKESEVQDSVGHYRLSIPDVEDLLTPLLATIPLQLFAYHMAVLRDCDVDKPRNLAKSVTVE